MNELANDHRVQAFLKKYDFTAYARNAESIETKILNFLATGPKTKTQLYELSGHNWRSTELKNTLDALWLRGIVNFMEIKRDGHKGRPTTLWFKVSTKGRRAKLAQAVKKKADSPVSKPKKQRKTIGHFNTYILGA